MVWLYRPTEAYKLSEVKTTVGTDKCKLITHMSVDTGNYYEVITEEMKTSLEARQSSGDLKVNHLFSFIKIPTFEYQLLVVRYKSDLKDSTINAFKLNDVAGLINPKAPIYHKYQDALC